MITKKNTGYDDSPVEYWEKHTVMEFETGKELLEWILSDNKSLILSNLIFDASIDCIRGGHSKIVVVTFLTSDNVEIDVMASSESFELMLSNFATRLLNLEQYERLSEIKEITKSLGLTFPTL